MLVFFFFFLGDSGDEIRGEMHVEVERKREERKRERKREWHGKWEYGDEKCFLFFGGTVAGKGG